MSTPVTGPRRAVACLAALLLTLGLCASLGPRAVAAETTATTPRAIATEGAGTVSGAVTDTDSGLGLGGIDVTAYCSYDGDGYSYWEWCWDDLGEPITTVTASDGHYQLTMPPGSYRIGFVDPERSHFAEYYPRAELVENAADVTLGADAVVTGIDESLRRGGRITGRVTDPDGLSLDSADIEAYREDDGDLGAEELYAFTDDDGYYTLGPLPDGDYRLAFSAWGYVSEFYADQPSLQAADPLQVRDAATLTADAGLGTGASISGTVTDEDGAPLEDVSVTVYQYEPVYDYWDWWDNTTTDAAGHYALRALTPGTPYRIGFESNDGTYVGEFYDDRDSLDRATDIVLAEEQTFTADAALATAGRIAGVVTAADGEPMPDVEIEVHREVDGDLSAAEFYGYTEADGSYEVGGLPDGDYRVAFQPYDEVHAHEFYDDRPTLEQADVLHLAGSATLAADAQLGLLSVITGTVTDEGGAALADISVELYDGDAGTGEWNSSTCCWQTDAGGNYRIAVAPGRYTLGFEDPAGVHRSEFYDDQSTLQQADEIIVGENGTVVADASLELGSSITGTVSDEDGAPLEAVRAVVYQYEPDYDSWYWWNDSATDEDGHYAIGGLSPDTTYRVRFLSDDGAYVEEYYDDQDSLAQATDIVLGGQQTFTADAVLARAAQITGTIRGEDAQPLAEVGVTAYRLDPASQDWLWADSAWSPDGSYTIGGLVPGTYRVEFRPDDPFHREEYFDDAATLEDADDVTLAQGQVATVDATLTLAYGAISGVVTGADDEPLADVWVSAEDGSGSWYSTITAEDGSYRLARLTPDAYRVLFDTGADDFHGPEYYDGAATADQATPVTVTLGDTTTADADLPVVGGALTGTVRGAEGSPLDHVRATLYRHDGDPGGWYAVAWTSTTSDGGYRFRRQPAGTYRIGFETDDGVHLSGFHGGADLAGATDIDLRLGELTTVDATLAVGAAIAGLVTGADSEPLTDVTVTLYRVDPDTGTSAERTASTGADGRYRFGPLPAGTYRLGYRHEQTHATEYFDDTASLDQAQDLELDLGESVTADAVLAPRIANVAAPTIEGTPRIGELLTVDVGTWNYDDATYTYQWYRDGAPIVDGNQTDGSMYAVGPSYTPTNDNAWLYGTDLGTQLTVHVTAAKPGHLPTEVASAAVGPVLPGLIANLTPPAISGTARVGETLSAGGDTWQPASVTRAYTWLRDDRPTGVTGTSYPLAAADLGARISVRASASKDAYVTASASSAVTEEVALGVIVNQSSAALSGIPRAGETLTADPGTWHPADVTPRYQWLRDGQPIGGGTEQTYLLTEADATHAVSVEVTATKTAYAPTGSTSSATPRVTYGLIANTTAPSVGGTIRVGQMLSVDPGAWSTDDLTLAYHWLRDGQPTGATGDSYQLAAADLDHEISVRVEATRADYDPGSATSAAVGPIALGHFASIAPPSVEGTPQVGGRLSIAGNSWEPTPQAATYQWLRDGDPIDGATETSYLPGPADVDGRISVEVRVTRDAYEPAVLRSEDTTAVALGQLDNTEEPTISGSARVGKTLSASAGAWAPAGVTPAYQWRRDGEPIGGATASTYLLVPADANARITVAVTATLEGYAASPAVSPEVGPVTYDVVTSLAPPSVTGTARVGETLTATDGDWAPTGTAAAYQWLRDGSPIPGATARTRVLRAADLGARISVEVTASLAGHDPGRTTSAETAAVTEGVLSNVTLPSINGITRVERTLSAEPGAWSPVSVDAYAYQWLRDGDPIDDATDATYLLTDEDLSSEMGLRVTATKAGYQPAAAASAPTAAIRAANHAPSAEVTVTPGPTGAAPYQTTIEVRGDDPEGDPLTYRIDLGDGTAPQTGSLSDSTAVIDHLFTAVGSFAVRVQVGDGESTTTRIFRVTALLPEPLVAVGGDPVTAVAGASVALDAGASRPAGLIDSYAWDFGDGHHGSGVAARHTYAAPGTYTVALTVTAGSEVATATTTVTVTAAPVAPGLQVRIKDGSTPLSGAQATVRLPDGSRISGVTDGTGSTTLHGLPDGSAAVDVWAPGYLPATVASTLTDGGGSLDVALVRGDVGSAVIESHPLTLDELWDRGIDLDAAENQHIFEAEIQLHFVQEVEQPEPEDPRTYEPASLPVTLVAVEGGGYHLGCAAGCPGGGGGSGGGLTLGGATYTPTIIVVEGAPIIEWLVIPVRGSWAKEFFDVSMIVQNLGTGAAAFRPGLATLELPTGLSLATTWEGDQQALTRDVPAIPAGGSETISWTVRGDMQGRYDLHASYDSVLDPFDAPISLLARSASPLHVWAGSALTLGVEVDAEVERWMPYRVTTTLTNSTCAALGAGCDEIGPTLHNVRLALGERPEDAPADQARFVYGPNEQTEAFAMSLAPGESVSVDTIVMPGIGTDDDDPATPVPLGDAEVVKEKVVRVMQLDTARSMLAQTGGTEINIDDEIHVHPDLTPHTPVTIETADNGTGDERIELTWDPVSLPGRTVTGYRVYTRDSLTGGTWRVLPAGTGSTTWPAGTTQASYPLGMPGLGGYFTVIAVYAGGTLATHRLAFGPPRYVAMGDSFSSGEGVPVFDPGTATDLDPDDGPSTWEKAWALVTGDEVGNTCHRSGKSYSRLLASEPQFEEWLTPAMFAACSGAIAKDLAEPNPNNQHEPAQNASLSQATRAVTLTMGGNDADFGGIIASCLNPVKSCAAELYGNSGVRWEWLARTEVELTKAFDTVTSAAEVVSTCAAAATMIGLVDCARKMRDYGLALKRLGGDRDRDASAMFVYAGQLSKRLEASYEDALGKAPNATLYVADYPKQLSAGRASKACEVTPLGGFSVIDPVEGVLLNGFVDDLNEQIRAALAKVQARHPDRSVVYVPVASRFQGHELCVDGELNPETAFNPLINPALSWPDAYGAVAYSFHPNKRGQELYRDAFQAAMTGQTRELVEIDTSSIQAAQGEVPPFTAAVVARVRHSAVTPVEVSLLGPGGQIVRAGDEGTTSGDADGVAWLRLADPAPGLWRVQVELADPAPAEGASLRTLLAGVVDPDEPSAPTLVEVELSVQSDPGTPVASATVSGPTAGSYRFDASDSHGQGDEELDVDWLFADGTTATGRVVDHQFPTGVAPSAMVTVTTQDGRSASADVTLAPQPDPALVSVGEPAITADVAPGEPIVPGVTLTASGDWIPQPASSAIRWLRDGEPIGGASAATYQVTAQDAGHALRVEITAVRDGFQPGVARSPVLAVADGPQEPTIANDVRPAITGTPTVGETLTVTTGTWSPVDVVLSYAWFAAGTAIQGATGTGLTLTIAELGKAITVQVTATRNGASLRVTTAATAEVRAAVGGGGGGGVTDPSVGPDSPACASATDTLASAQAVLAEAGERLKSVKAKLKKAKKTAQVKKLRKKAKKLKQRRNDARATVATAVASVDSVC
ncbi:carboxypeptidase regulatory-like domain-containing protein [Nocardioides carbamazepini]|uniref:carboxypeptidase regulatory-like domain-containing protein n=1 Tax=Nocardioides carbamazepini TaxID=2854259 RepID=UPI002149A284|nr:carboxypeptidase regulatory-like domain-containing protein [Nocardioides carbamazepini]MCR1782128.1 carboxypeptidase regulatory-like domain-containing protein [Nocardioides carbamazepini]